MKRNALKITFALSAVLLVTAVQAQVNKVPNPNFEEIEKKIKGPGQIEAVLEWYSPEGMEPADVFCTDAKKEEVQVPMNIRGRAETVEGKNMVGILAYSEREAKPRTYIQTKMAKKLVAGKKYCIKMHISLSDLSKYAVDNVGMLLSGKALRQKDLEAYDQTPQLTYVGLEGNNIVDDQYDWVELCREYEADGTERYVTIGNFAPQSAVKSKKMRRPREFKTPQTRDAYYYVDAVSVIALGHLEGPCDCTVKPSGPVLDVKYTHNVSEGMEGSAAERIEHAIVHFDLKSDALNDEDKEKLNSIATLMKEDAAVKINVVGHTAANEDEMVASKRATAVKAYLAEQGVDGGRITVEGRGYTEPKVEGEDARANAENRRVQFEIK
ncbi:OmpA family protein [bacterium SCSIO 12741]|nr:OmpA family protein [bacterium SCSIO 12741]